MDAAGFFSMPRVEVYGSAVIRTEPDTVAVEVAVSRTEMEPERAFASTREGAQDVIRFLKKARVKDYGTSQVTLSQDFEYVDGQREFVGYTGRIQFRVLSREMGRTDALISGLIAAGANTLSSVTFQTTRLDELRAEARRQAVAAAREKAKLYCQAAGASVGRVLSIRDQDPDSMSHRHENRADFDLCESAPSPSAIDPEALTVSAAVTIIYQIMD